MFSVLFKLQILQVNMLATVPLSPSGYTTDPPPLSELALALLQHAGRHAVRHTLCDVEEALRDVDGGGIGGVLFDGVAEAPVRRPVVVLRERAHAGRDGELHLVRVSSRSVATEGDRSEQCDRFGRSAVGQKNVPGAARLFRLEEEELGDDGNEEEEFGSKEEEALGDGVEGEEAELGYGEGEG